MEHARTRQQRECSRINNLGVAGSMLSSTVSYWFKGPKKRERESERQRDAAPPKGYGHLFFFKSFLNQKY